jgi:MFS family permease
MSSPPLSSSKARWLVLLLGTLAMLGNTYIYDNPSALHDQLRDHFAPPPTFDDVSAQLAGLDRGGPGHAGAGESADSDAELAFEYDFNMLYTVYSLPNVVLPVFGGALVDRFGAARMLSLFACMVTLGQLLLSSGVSWRSMPLMLVGRVVFGLGGESMCVGSNAVLKEWFSGREFAMAMGVQLSVARLGSVINNLACPYLADRHGIAAPFWVGLLVCLLSLAAALALFALDGAHGGEERDAARAARARAGEGARDAAGSGPPGIERGGPLAPACARVERSCPDVRGFGLSFWLLVVSCVVVYGAVLPFNNVASPFLIHKYYCDGDCCAGSEAQCPAQLDAQASAAVVMSIPYTVSALLAPAVGAFVDWIGLKAVLCLSAAVMLFFAHALLGLTAASPIVPLALIGIGYSLYSAAVWPAVPDVVPDARKGVAFGVVTAVQNGGLALFPVLVAAMRAHTHSYEPIEIFFALLAGLGIGSGVLLNWDDMRSGDRLNGPRFREVFAPCLRPLGLLSAGLEDASRPQKTRGRRRANDDARPGASLLA